ncbi:MAG: DUF4105 domain-containing protein [Bacteroidales bacterium]|nr:DUF4105 domain-containing protein [Bacteroidales bacterium]
MKRIFGILMLLLLCGNIRTQELSDSAFASLITCGPGNDFYTTFGHTALRICDPAQQADVVFNYGTFNFNTPHFYLKFARGILQYQLSASSYASFMAEYKADGRTVIEQRLLLTHEELEKLFNALCVNFLPKNRYYAYDFFIDNCATRVRDQIESALVGRHFYRSECGDDNLSFRQLLHPPMEQKLEWWKFGIDLVLGARCDRKATTLQYMFLPEHLMVQSDTGRFEGTLQPLAEPAHQLLPERREELSDSFPPDIVLWAVLLVYGILSLSELLKKRTTCIGKVADTLLYTATSLLSLLIVFLWFFTAHYCTKWNLNLLWANPLFICMLFRRKRSGIAIPLILYICCGISLFILLFQWPQAIPTAALPLMFTLMLRLYVSGIRNRRVS